MQRLQRPLTLKLSSIYTFEEMQVIIGEFFSKITSTKRLEAEDSLNVFVKIEEISAPHCGVNLLNSVRYFFWKDKLTIN